MIKSIPKFFRQHKYPFISDKRQRFAIQTVILTAGIFTTQLIWQDFRFTMVGILSVITYILTIWSLYEDIRGAEWVLLFILPVLFTATVSLFYFLLPARWFVRLLISAIFALGTYATLLVENIYNVAAERSIQLLRAAQSVGLLITLAVVFLVTNIIFSIRAYYYYNFLYIIPVIFILTLNCLWSINLEEKISQKVIIYSLLVSVSIGEVVMALSFWPIKTTTASLFITASYYTLVGIIQQHLYGRLFMNTIKEYIYAFIFTLIITILTTSWN